MIMSKKYQKLKLAVFLFIIIRYYFQLAFQSQMSTKQLITEFTRI